MRVYIDLLHMMILLATIIYIGYTLLWHACMMFCYHINSYKAFSWLEHAKQSIKYQIQTYDIDHFKASWSVC